MQFPRSAFAFVSLFLFTFLVGSFDTVLGQPGVADPDQCIVDPWDQFEQVFVSPGTGSVDDVEIWVNDAGGQPIPDAFVEVDLQNCDNLCVDYPDDGLTGITDQSGFVALNPRVGGCQQCNVEVRANGVVIREYYRVVSPDWDGSRADGHVTAADLDFFAESFIDPWAAHPCSDFNGDLQVSLLDLSMFRSSYYLDYNDWPCAGDLQRGACCFDEICVLLTEEACQMWGGLWTGLLTCADNPCQPQPVPGACCLVLQGGMCQMMLEVDCYNSVGVWDGAETCSPDPCPENLESAPCPPPGLDVFGETHAAFMFDPPGAGTGPRPILANGPTTVIRRYREFEPGGPCQIDTEMLMLELQGVFNPNCIRPQDERDVTVRLDATNPTYGTINSSDDGAGNPDFPNDSEFDVNVEIDIEGLGVYQHTVNDLSNILNDGNLWDFTPCIHPSDPYRPPSNDHAHIPCPEELPIGCCVVGTNEFYTNVVICSSLGGTYLGDGVTCPSCMPQACCFQDGTCQMLPPDDCFGHGGIPWGAGTTCDPNPCPSVGACCFGDVCALIAEDRCYRWGGIWMDLPSCSPNPCKPPEIGACCFGPDCVQMMEVDCVQQGGAWDGAVECVPNPCTQDDALGPPCPPPGLDIFDDTWAAFWLDVPGLNLGPRAVIAHGPTAVLRSHRMFEPHGPCIIDTEILELSLTGVFNPDCRDPLNQYDVTIRLDPQMRTLGTIYSSENGFGDPDFPAESFFDVFVEIDIDGHGTFTHEVAELGNLLHDGDLWADPPCVHPSDPYQPPSNDHAHIPCPDSLPPTGCCVLGPNEFYTYEVLCDALGGTYLGDNVDCPDGCPYISGVADGVIEGIEIGEVTPNPSFGTVTLRYALTADAEMQIDLFDPSGRLVRRFAVGRQGAGAHEFVWDGKNREGDDLPAGVYFMTLQSGDVRVTRGVVLLR